VADEELLETASAIGSQIGQFIERTEVEERYRTLVENTPVVSYTNAIGDPSTCVYISPQIESLTGYTAEEWLGDDGDVHYVRTGWEAPNGRIMAVDLAHPERSAWRELVPERDDALESAGLFGDTLVLTYLRDAHHVVVLHGLRDGVARELPLPGLGSVAGFNGRRSDPETFFEYSSFTEPTDSPGVLTSTRNEEAIWVIGAKSCAASKGSFL